MTTGSLDFNLAIILRNEAFWCETQIIPCKSG